MIENERKDKVIIILNLENNQTIGIKGGPFRVLYRDKTEKNQMCLGPTRVV